MLNYSPSPVDVAVIIVNYATAELTIACVESVLRHHHGGRRIEIHVVDNPSPQGDDARILAAAIRDRSWDGRVMLYAQEANLGFGRANNVVMKAISDSLNPPQYVFLLNPDAELTNDAIAELANFLDVNEKVAIAGSGLFRPGDDQPISAAFRFPSMTTEFFGAANVGLLGRVMSTSSTNLPPKTYRHSADWVSGAAFMARLDALIEVNFFDPDYFLYFEEVDLMLRLKRAGWEIWHVPESKVTHIAGSSTGIKGGRSMTGRMPSYWYESWRMYHRKNYGRTVALGCAGAKLSGWAINTVVRALQRRPSDVPSHGWGDFFHMVVMKLLIERKA